MEAERFQAGAPGELVRAYGNDWAFVPDPLPPKWIPDERVWRLLVEAKEQLGVLEGLGRTLKNPELLLSPLRRREAISSSSLEGTYATPQELLLFELDRPESKDPEDKVNAWREVDNYASALHLGATSELPLSLRLIRLLHERLLRGVRGRDQRPGEFRQTQVHIGHDRRFIPPPALHLAACLSDLEKYIHADDECVALVRCFLTHYQFETIHPFLDGNGRVGRLLLALMLQQSCSLTKPWVYMSAFFDRYRDEYVDRLFKVSTSGAWQDWIEFCLKGTISQARDTVVRCDGLRLLREEYQQRLHELGGSLRLNQLVEGLFESPFIRITDAQRQLGVTYPTAKSDIEKLVEAKILVRLPNAKQATFFSDDIFELAYSDH